MVDDTYFQGIAQNSSSGNEKSHSGKAIEARDNGERLFFKGEDERIGRRWKVGRVSNMQKVPTILWILIDQPMNKNLSVIIH